MSKRKKPWKVQRRDRDGVWRNVPELEYRTQDRANAVAGQRRADDTGNAYRVRVEE